MAGKSSYRRFRCDFCLPVLFLNRLEYNMNLQRYFLFLLVIPFLFACDEQDNWEKQPDAVRGIVFHLTEEPFDGETLQTTKSTGEFSRVEHLIVTDEGDPVPNIKSTYLAESRKILAEGLHTGSYKLLVLGIIGDESKDQATVHTISSIHDTWLSFPENLQRPLEAEYFYAQIPFTVSLNSQGKEESSLSEVSLKRIIGKVSFDFSYNNDYVRTAVTGLTLHLPNTRFYTTFSANQEYSGQSDGTVQIQSLQEKQEFLFMRREHWLHRNGQAASFGSGEHAAICLPSPYPAEPERSGQHNFGLR